MQTQHNTEYSGLSELLNNEVMTNYNEFIVETALQDARSPGEVVDFGAGIGTLALIFQNRFGISCQCVEIDEQNKAFLAERKLRHFNSLEQLEGQSEMIFSSNVLEHIQDDVAVLSSMKEKLKQNGKIYLFLPAKMVLWSPIDEQVGHYRRYELSEIREKCKQVGLKIERLHYADSLGFFAWFMMKWIGYSADKGAGSVKSLKFYDKWIFPLSRWLDRLGLKYFFGKNLVLVAKSAD